LDVFESDWAHAGNEPSPAELRTIRAVTDTRLAVAGPRQLGSDGRLSIVAALSEVIDGAKENLDIEVNSFSTRVDLGPGERFGLVESLLGRAASRGVSVRLLVDRWAYEHEPRLFQALDSLGLLEVRVADIRSAGPNPTHGTVHSKVVIADSRVLMLGTATFSQRQLTECRNVALLCKDAGAVDLVSSVFRADWESEYVRPVPSAP
jgi:phosphatidylserine/phosphatidylglycerophosphate/cardiolipin synthase-like enzyme